MVKALHTFSPPGSTGYGWVERGLQAQLRLLECVLVPNVPQELREPEVPWHVDRADAMKHPQVGLEPGEQVLGSIRVHVTTRLCLLRMLDERVHGALQRSIAASGVRLAPTACLDCHVGRLLHRGDCAIPARLHHDGTLAAHPGEARRPVFVVMTTARLMLLAAPTRPAALSAIRQWRGGAADHPRRCRCDGLHRHPTARCTYGPNGHRGHRGRWGMTAAWPIPKAPRSLHILDLRASSIA
jgi:hypothetical protein